MSSTVVGLWLNGIPNAILSNDADIREICKIILQGHRGKEIFVADCALLITLGITLPNNFIIVAAQNLRRFLRRKNVSREETDTVTLSPYTDKKKWEVLKEQITVAASTRDWNTKAPEDWTTKDTLKWLRDKNLGQYCLSFKENDLDGRTLLELNESDLRDLGIRSLGHRKTLWRLLNQIRNFKSKYEERDQQLESEKSYELKYSYAYSGSHSGFKESSQESTLIQRDLTQQTLVVCGLSQRLLEDDTAVAEIKKSVVAEHSIKKFDISPNGILISFWSPLSDFEREELQARLVTVLKRLKCQQKEDLKVDFCDEGKVTPSSVLSQESKRDSMRTTNYWTEFWEKLMSTSHVEDYFSGEDSKLNARAAREVLATVRDVDLKEIKKNDPGIKHLKGFRKAELEKSLSNCEQYVKNEIEGTQPVDTPTSKPIFMLDQGTYVGMHIECLPRSIIDDDHCLYGIQKLVFKDVEVRRMVVLDEESSPILKIEFLQWITSEKIPAIAHNLRTYLKGSKVSEETINNVRLSCLVYDNMKQVGGQKRSSGERNTLLGKKDEFLVTPGKSIETARTILIEGIPTDWLVKFGFLSDMREKVFEGVALNDISLTPATVGEKANSQKNVQICFQTPLNLQKLPMIALRLKKFLKNGELPPLIVDGITIHIRNDNHLKIDSKVSKSVAVPVVGLLFKGIPKRIITNFGMVSAMKAEVLTDKHAVRFMEPIEEDWKLRILMKAPICRKKELTAIALRLKRFLYKRGVQNSDLKKVLMMTLTREEWEKLKLHRKKILRPISNPNDYVGVEIENMPASVTNSFAHLECLEKLVFSKQKVSNVDFRGNTLRIEFGVAADKKSVEQAVRDLKQVLFQLRIPLEQINNIFIVPHTADTWGSPSPSREKKKRFFLEHEMGMPTNV